MKLYDEQLKAFEKMHNGSILVGGVGSGKSITSIYYYFVGVCNGSISPFKFMKHPLNLFIITTARKRDTREWIDELAPFRLVEGNNDIYGITVTVDSWNNIQKYSGVENSFFIFDEQRLVTLGAWSRAFIKISKKNKWVLLSATPGDDWSDYLAVFIANGFVKNKTEFDRRYCVFKRFSKFPQIERYLEEDRLERMRKAIIVPMEGGSDAEKIHSNIVCDYDKELYLKAQRKRWNYETEEPFKDAGDMCRYLRKVVNTSFDRIDRLVELLERCDKVIIFYNYNYELDILRTVCKTMKRRFAEWNGKNHELIPRASKWIYLVQYTAGAEGWNCIETDTIIFYSSNYSYKIMIQAAGRTDRLNTPYKKLYYYHLTSKSSIDRTIEASLKRKKNFNEKAFAKFK